MKRNGTGGKNQPESPAQLTPQVDPAQRAERVYGCTPMGDGDPFKVEMELFVLDCPFQNGAENVLFFGFNCSVTLLCFR